MSLIDDIKKHEGYSKKVYLDHLGKETIGIGFLVSALELDEDICDEILKRLLIRKEVEVTRRFGWFESLPQEAKDIVLNMVYQLGLNGFSKFKKTIHYLKEQNWKACSLEMLDSLWAKQTPNRAKELSERMANINEGI
jgi:lysozyme